jgi:hypothetical protein
MQDEIIIDKRLIQGKNTTLVSIEQENEQPLVRVSLFALEELSDVMLAIVFAQIYEHRTDDKYEFKTDSLIENDKELLKNLARRAYYAYIENMIVIGLDKKVDFSDDELTQKDIDNLIVTNLAELAKKNEDLKGMLETFIDKYRKGTKGDYSVSDDELKALVANEIEEIKNLRGKYSDYGKKEEEIFDGLSTQTSLDDILEMLSARTNDNDEKLKANLVGALGVLLGESVEPSKLEEVLMGKFRTLIQNKYWEGTDIIDVQRRSITEGVERRAKRSN